MKDNQVDRIVKALFSIFYVLCLIAGIMIGGVIANYR